MSKPLTQEEIAAQRFVVMNLVRIGAVIDILFGIAIAQGFFDLPYVAGVVLALLGVAVFFFVPPLLARRWKNNDREKDGE